MTEHCLFFASFINANSANAFLAYLVDLQVKGATKLTIAISSPGGNVVNGVTMYNAMLAMNYEITTHNIGNVDSIANAVFLGGGKRLTNNTSTFMFHSVGFEGNANERLEEKNILEKLDIIKSEHKRISSIIAGRTHLKLRDCVGLFKKQATRDAQWAVDAGLANGISEFKIPAQVEIRYII